MADTITFNVAQQRMNATLFDHPFTPDTLRATIMGENKFDCMVHGVGSFAFSATQAEDTVTIVITFTPTVEAFNLDGARIVVVDRHGYPNTVDFLDNGLGYMASFANNQATMEVPLSLFVRVYEQLPNVVLHRPARFTIRWG